MAQEIAEEIGRIGDRPALNPLPNLPQELPPDPGHVRARRIKAAVMLGVVATTGFEPIGRTARPLSVAQRHAGRLADEMHDPARGDVPSWPSALSGIEALIDVVEICIISLVEQPSYLHRFATDDHAGARNPVGCERLIFHGGCYNPAAQQFAH